MRDALAGLDADAGRILDGSPRGVSMIIGPDAEPVCQVLCEEEGILYADIDLDACVEPKQFHDVVGSYNRFDIFHLTVDRSPNRPVTFLAEDVTGTATPSATVEAGADEKPVLEITG